MCIRCVCLHPYVVSSWSHSQCKGGVDGDGGGKVSYEIMCWLQLGAQGLSELSLIC